MGGLDFARAQIGGDLVENGVDVFVAMFSAEGFGEFHGFVQDDLVGNLGVKLELVGPDAHAGELDRIHVIQLAVEMRRDVIVKLVNVPRDLTHQMVKVLDVNAIHLVVENEMIFNVAWRLLCQLPLIEGQLTEQVRRRPYAVVLFDEIEKAHPDVFNILLQIMDDGRLTDGKGRKVDFRNTVIIMTSNIGSAFLQAEGLRSPEEFAEASKQVMNALHGHFKPEFLNRVDDIIIFSPLGKEQLVKIIELRLEDVRRLLADRKISLELTDAAKDLLFTEGFDPNYGARPLKRAIQKLVQDPLALKILDGEVLHGDHVVVDADKRTGKMAFQVSKRVGEKEPAKTKA